MRKSIQKMLHPEMNEQVAENLIMKDIVVRFKLDELLIERGITQKDLAEITGLRQATISKCINMDRISINLGHLVTFMLALQITDITDILEFEFSQKLVKTMKVNREEWLHSKEIPKGIKSFIPNNEDNCKLD